MKNNNIAIILSIIVVMCMAVFGSVSAKDTFTVGLECNYAPFNWTQTDDANGAVPISGGMGYCGGYDV